jgi:hypothetical protein
MSAPNGTSYSAGRFTFATRDAMDAAVSERLALAPKDLPFEDELLLAIINELHPEVVAAGQRATRLEYVTWPEQERRGLPIAATRRIALLMRGYFEPLGDWRDVTVRPWKRSSPRVEVKQAFRTVINTFLPRAEALHRCTMPGCAAPWQTLEYQHVNPTFDEIAEACLAKCTEAEIAGRFGYSKFTAPASATSMADVIPVTHPAIVLLFKLHKRNQWAWLCPQHHRKHGSATPAPPGPVQGSFLALDAATAEGA